MSEIVFTATVYKVQTMPYDHGIRLTLDLAEDNIPEMAMLAEVRREGMALVFTARAEGPPVSRKKNRNDRQDD